MNQKQNNPVSNNESFGDSSELQNNPSFWRAKSCKTCGDEAEERQADRALSYGKSAGWRGFLHLPQPARMTPHEASLAGAIKDMKVRATPRTRIIEVLVRSTDREEAWQVAETGATVHHGKPGEPLEDGAAEQRIPDQGNQRHAQDAGTVRGCAAARPRSRMVFTDDQQNNNVANQKLQQIQQQLSQATTDRIAKQSRYELARTSAPESVPDVLSDGGLRDEQAKITDLRRQVAQLSVTFTPEYSKVQELQAQLTALETAFQHDRASIIDRIKDDYQDASRREDLLSRAYTMQTKDVTGQDEKEVHYNILKREVESNRQLYDTMLQQLKQSSLAAALGAAKVRVIDPAAASLKPVSPDFKVNTAWDCSPDSFWEFFSF